MHENYVNESLTFEALHGQVIRDNLVLYLIVLEWECRNWRGAYVKICCPWTLVQESGWSVAG